MLYDQQEFEKTNPSRLRGDVGKSFVLGSAKIMQILRRSQLKLEGIHQYP